MRSRSIHILLLLTLFAGATVRLLHVHRVDRQAAESRWAPYLFPDSHNFREFADTLRETGTYRDALHRHAWRTPGYPLFLLALDAVGLGSPPAVRRVHILLDTLNILLVFLLAAHLFRPVTGLLAAAIFAFYPFLIYMNALVISETLSHTLLLLALLLLAWWTVPRPGMASAPLAGSPRAFAVGGLLLGGVLGGAVLVKTSFAFIVAFVVGFLLLRGLLPERSTATPPALHLRRRTLCGAGLVLAGWVAVMAPWWIRNAHVFGSFVPFSTMSGFTLWEATGPGADGGPNHDKVVFPEGYALLVSLPKAGRLWPPEREHPEYGRHPRGTAILTDRAETSLFFGSAADVERKADRMLRAELRAEWRRDPVRILRLSGNKFLRTWSPLPNWEGAGRLRYRLAMLFSYVPVLLLAGYASWRCRRRWREVGGLWIPVIYLALLHAVVMGSIRYRHPALGGLIVLAAAGLVLWVDSRRAGRGTPCTGSMDPPLPPDCAPNDS